MTRLNKTADPVRPSAPDPVDAWLDVLVAMLSIPKPDRQRVRDELEDHLRSRIDDLLIHGLTEPQALQKAVAELGETADLARQLSHAHKPPRTRRYAMHALLIALAGTVVALGVNTMRPSVAATAPSLAVSEANAAASPEVTATEGKELSQELLATVAVMPVGRAFDFFEALHPFAVKLNLPLEIDFAALGERGLTALDTIMLPETPERSLAAILDSMTYSVPVNDWHKHGRPADRILAAKLGGKLVVTTQHGFELRTLTRVVYTLARFAENAPDPVQGTHAEVAYERLLRAVSQHVSSMDWQDNGGDLATGTILGSSLIVTAPARIHEQIEVLLDDLHAQAVEQAEQRQAAEAARREAAAREHNQLVSRVKAEYERALSELNNITIRIERLTANGSRLQLSIASLPVENREKEAESIYQSLAVINADIRSLRTRMEESTARVEYLRSRMIEIEYEPLVISRDLTSTRNRNVQPGLVEVRGDVARVGVYEHHAGLTLRRMLVAAGWTPESVSSTIQLIRDGKVVGEWSATSLSGVDAAILSGDIIAVSD